MTSKTTKLSILMLITVASGLTSCATTHEHQEVDNEIQEVKIVENSETYPDQVGLTGGFVTVTPQVTPYLDGRARLIQIFENYEAEGQQLFIVPNLSSAAVEGGVEIPIPFLTNDGLLQFQSDYPEFFDNYSKYIGTIGFGTFVPLN